MNFSDSCIILAAGDQTRWNIGNTELPRVKQLLNVRGEILLDRMKRQFNDPVCFTKEKEIQEHFARCYEPEDNTVTVATLNSTRYHWREWTTILLGDVYYGRRAVKKIKAQYETLMFYGDDEEIYAMKFHESQKDNILRGIYGLVHHPRWEMKYGKLWNLYRFMNGINFTEHLIGGRFTEVFDCADFDAIEDYYKFTKT